MAESGQGKYRASIPIPSQKFLEMREDIKKNKIILNLTYEIFNLMTFSAGRRGDHPGLLLAPVRLHTSLPDVQREPAEPPRVPRRPGVRRRLHRHHDSLLGVQRVHRIHQHDVGASGKSVIDGDLVSAPGSSEIA